MSFCFGLRPPKAVSALRDFNARGRQSSALRDFNARGRQSRPCAKVFTCGENACTAHSRRWPEGRVGAVLSACREFENIQIVVTSQKERHDQRSCLSFWVSAAGGGLHPLEFECSEWQSHPCAKIFAFSENACTAQKRRGPERPLGDLQDSR